MGIEVAAESRWQEGVCPANITIRRNQVIECARAKKAAICVMADCDQPSGTPIQNITIEDNWIDCPEAPHGIYLRGVDGYSVARNQIRSRDNPIVIEGCIDDRSASAISPVPS
jgi:hypothetical protein